MLLAMSFLVAPVTSGWAASNDDRAPFVYRFEGKADIAAEFVYLQLKLVYGYHELKEATLRCKNATCTGCRRVCPGRRGRVDFLIPQDAEPTVDRGCNDIFDWSVTFENGSKCYIKGTLPFFSY